jgi:hypothetical protein
MQAATCNELERVEFVQQLAERAGLLHLGLEGNARYYASASIHALSSPGHGPSGMWQDPLQLATALVHIASRFDVRSYLELGVWSCWTCCFVSSYLRRVSSAGSVWQGIAVDTKVVQRNFISRTVRLFMSQLNISFVRVDQLNGSLQHRAGRQNPARPSERTRFDLCFIDALHAYEAVLRDYLNLAPSCSAMMFHDVHDLDIWAGHTPGLGTSDSMRAVFPLATVNGSANTIDVHQYRHELGRGLKQGRRGSGSTVFWANLVAAAGAGRATTITKQLNLQQPTFGIGVLAPGVRGDGTLDGNGQLDPHPYSSSAAADWRWLCVGLEEQAMCRTHS